MPCRDSSSSISLILDHDDRFLNFTFAKITCGQPITAETKLNNFLKGQTIHEILCLTYADLVTALAIDRADEERLFILYLEWEALKSALAAYLGDSVRGAENLDTERCRVTSIDADEDHIEISLVILPPKDMPKILPCHLADDS